MNKCVVTDLGHRYKRRLMINIIYRTRKENLWQEILELI